MAAHSTITINAPADKVFDIITDLPAYANWLPNTSTFPGITEISDSPLKLGSTYTEASASGIRHGKVIEYERGSKVVFHQPMKLYPVESGILIDIKVQVVLKESEDGVTTVERDVFLGMPDALKEQEAGWYAGAGQEGDRVMGLLKEYVERVV